jgi:hypothetical protein
MYERALRALPWSRPIRCARCDLMVALARCLIASGAVAQAAARALEAAALARAAGDGHRLAAAALAFGSEIRIAIIDPTLVGLLEEALAALPAGDLSIRPVVMARLPPPASRRSIRRAEAALAREAIALARKSGDPGVIRRTLHNALAALVDYAARRSGCQPRDGAGGHRGRGSRSRAGHAGAGPGVQRSHRAGATSRARTPSWTRWTRCRARWATRAIAGAAALEGDASLI